MKNNSILKSQYGARNKRLKMNKMTYLEYLKSNRWKRLRQKALEKNSKCEVCGSNKFLNCHHRRYTRIFEKDGIALQDIVVLCGICHCDLHKLSKENNFGLSQAVRRLKTKDKF